MRIPTITMNETAKRAHLPLGNTSLLNYINNNNSGSIVGSRSKNPGMELISNNLFQRLEKNAGELSQSADKLTDKEEDLFDEARESGSNEELVDEIGSFAKYFNSTMSSATGTNSSLNVFYRKMMAQAAIEHKEELEAIGVKVMDDGMLDVNRDRLGRADVDQIERVFGAGSDFMKQVTTLAHKLSDNAGAGASSFASLYSASGSPYSSYMANNYDYFG